VAEVSELKTPEVMALEEMEMLAVTVPLIAGSEPMVTELPTVTVPPTVTALARSWVFVKDASVKVTACEAGKLRTETLPVVAPKVTD
jgi:hypothetical protein